MARDDLVSVTISVTSMDHVLSRKLEPRASSPEKRLEAIRLLNGAGVPAGVNVAPVIPAINDMEIERILDAAAAQGACGAGMIPLRLPGEVRDIFREWLLRYFPDRLRHVMSLVRDIRGGRDNDPEFGSRMVGEGPYAVLLQQRFAAACARYGLAGRSRPLSTDLFVPPKPEKTQLELF
jgi:DNA repair photolyase